MVRVRNLARYGKAREGGGNEKKSTPTTEVSRGVVRDIA